jgi:mono/diheme cytochrome c family protein
MRSLTRRELGLLAGTLLLLFGLIQLVPLGAARTNPPVIAEPSWNAPRTRELFARACADCHSNQTRWPWYARVAPVSWLVAYDVAEGREHFNVSEWNRPQKNARKAAGELREGEMPYRGYTLAHPEAQLGASEKNELIAGLVATFGDGGGQDGDEDDD